MEIKERILYAPGANETELLRSLAKRGIKTLGLRIMGSKDLAILAMERNGIPFDGSIFDDTLTGLIIYNILKEEKYFETVQLTDTLNFVKSINDLRLTIPDPELYGKLKNGAFEEKNAAILRVLGKIIQKFEAEKAYDLCSFIQNIIIKNITLDLDVFTISEFPLKPLEKKLLKSLKGYEEKPLDIKLSSSYQIEEYNSFYSEKAEAEYVLNYIFKNNIKLDECVVAATSQKYRRIFEDIALENKVPVTFGISKTVNETNAGKVLSLIIEWANDFYFVDKFVSIFNPNYMDLDKVATALDVDKDFLPYILKKCGDLRLSFNAEENKNSIEIYQQAINAGFIDAKEEQNTLYCIERMADILNQGLPGLLEFVLIKNEKEDLQAIARICDFYLASIACGLDVKQVLNEAVNISIGSTVSSEGSLYITTISKAKSVCRKYLFVVGMYSELYPGKPSEDYVILDTDYELLGFKGKKSHQTIEDKKKELKTLLSINGNNKIFISYPYYSTEDLKSKNASSLIYDIYNELNGGDKSVDDLMSSINKHQYFENNLSPSKEVGLAYSNGVLIKQNEEPVNEEFDVSLFETRKKFYSATDIDAYFRCPYRFYLERIIGLENDFESDSTDVIAPNELGTLIHEELSKLDITNTSKEDFLNSIKVNFLCKFVPTHSILSGGMLSAALADLFNIGENAYDMASSNEPFKVEEDLYVIHKPTGIGIHGFPDRSEKILDKKVKVIDYKIKNHFDHDEKQLFTCGQILTYAYILKTKFDVDICECEYRYLRQGVSVIIPSENLKEAFQAYDEKLIELKHSLETGSFEPAPEEQRKTVCGYCPYKDLCKACKDEEGEDD